MVAHTLYYRDGSGVSHAETLSCHTVDKGFSAGGAVECHVADDDVFILFKPAALGRVHNQLTAGKSFSEVVVAVAHQFQSQTFRDKGSEGLTAGTVTQHAVGTLLHIIPQASGDFGTEDGAKGTVGVRYIHLDAAFLFGGDGLV